MRPPAYTKITASSASTSFDGWIATRKLLKISVNGKADFQSMPRTTDCSSGITWPHFSLFGARIELIHAHMRQYYSRRGKAFKCGRRSVVRCEWPAVIIGFILVHWDLVFLAKPAA